ncbi:MAG: hypothetical protein H7Y12_04825 [Sphingobacteriaceae bacterium]|nr:hypothetical protein [Cytophagaceae bacterium]
MPTLLFAVLFYRAPGVVQNLQFVNSEASVTFGPLRLSFATGLLWLLFMWTFLVPALLIYWLYRLGFVQGLTLATRADRHVPYLVTAVLYSVLTYFLATRLSQLPEIALVLGSIAASIALVAAINLRYQISARAVGIGGVVGALSGLLLRYHEMALFEPLVTAVVLAGLVTSARLHLNAHSPDQIAAGLSLGVVVSLGTVVLFN